MKTKLLSIILGLPLLLLSTFTFAQSTLTPGNIAFIGVHTDASDQFTWIALTDIPASEQIYFTEKGWNSSGNTWFANNEGHILWIAPAGGLPCGTIVHITETASNTFSINLGVGTIGHVSGSWSQSAGDQVLAYQSTTGVEPAVPSFIAGLHGDYNSGDYNTTTTWNNGVSSINGSASQVPLGLTNGVNCVSLYPAPGAEFDNDRYTGTLTGTSTVLLAAINNKNNWTASNNSPILIDPAQYPTPSVTCVAACSAPDIPTVTATPNPICAGSSTTLNISGSLNDATAWWIYSGSCGGVQILGTTTTNSFTTAALTTDTTFYIRGEDGSGCVDEFSGSCGQVTVTVNALPTVTFTALADLCIDAGVQNNVGGGLATGGVYSGSGVTDDGNGMTYDFDPAAAGVGTHTITYNFTDGNGCSGSATDDVEVFALPTVTFTALADICLDAGVQAGLSGGAPTGGVYSGPGVTDDANGMTYSFDPAAAGLGTHTLTYNYSNANGCSGSASDDVEVFALPTVTFTALADICLDAGVQAGLSGGAPTGGVYSGPGVTDDANGMTYSFDPAAAGLGTHTLTYNYSNANGCSGSASDDVEVFALPTVTFTALADICLDAGVQAGLSGGAPTGGVYSGPGVTDDANGMTYSFDPAAAGVGTHTLTYNYSNANGCSGSASDDVEVFALPTVTFTALADICLDAGVQAGLSGGAPTGGVYSGPGVTDDANGMTYSFDPAAAGLGTHTLTYNYSNANGCSSSASDDVEVFALPTVTFTALADICLDAGVQAGLSGGAPTGGVYSGPGVTDDANGMTYSFDPAAAGLGTHTLTYNYSNANGCSSSASDDVEVFALPTVTFTALADICLDAGVQAGLSGGAPTGGVYSGPGVTDDANGMTYSFDPAAAGLGTHTLTYNYSNANGCSGSASDDVEVFALPTVTFTALADICLDAGVQAGLSGGTPTGGVYSGPGVTDDANGMTYSFDPAAAGVGIHTLTYSYSDANGCSGSASDDVEVFASDDASFNYGSTGMNSGSSYCLPTYTNQCTSGDMIDVVILNTIDNQGTGCAVPSSNNYSDYTAMSTDLLVNTSYPITFSPGPSWGQSFGAFIDLNYDGDFEDAGEFFDLGYVAAGGTGNATITIPDGTSVGTTRLRILCTFGSGGITQLNVCSNLTYGEVEDYTVNIITGSNTYCSADTNPTPTITGLAGGSFSSTPTGLVINAATGEIDVTASSNGTYSVTYTTTGSCANSTSVSVIIDECAPDNDSCSSATPLTLGVALSGETTAGATDDSTGATDDTDCQPSTFKADVWYTFEAPLTGAVNITTQISGSSDQANVAVYSSLDCSQLDADLIACSAGNGGESIDVPGLTVGQTYYIRVWSDGAAVIRNAQLTEGTFSLTVSETTLSTTDFDTNGFTYYPNPVENILTLKSEDTMSQIRVLNMLGQVVFRESTNATTKQLDLSNLQSGAYFVEVIMEGTDRTKTIRVIKE